jgi:CRISPR-associated protein Cas2
MLEIAPGVYTSPRMTAAVRERVWSVLEEWHSSESAGSVVMTWPDGDAPGGQRVSLLGEPAKDLWEIDGLILVRRDVAVPSSLKTE